jgi:hypothetical protein
MTRSYLTACMHVRVIAAGDIKSRHTAWPVDPPLPHSLCRLPIRVVRWKHVACIIVCLKKEEMVFELACKAPWLLCMWWGYFMGYYMHADPGKPVGSPGSADQLMV